MNRALRIHAYGGPEVMHIEQLDMPKAGPGEVTVQVYAAGINGLDWKIRDGLLQSVMPIPLPLTLGVELAGEVIEVGSGVSGFALGDRVMGALSGPGAYADQVVVAASQLALTPAKLDQVHAAAIPVTGLTAWQALLEAGGLKPRQTVLIHGAAGGVGGFAVQFARRIGAHVITTAQGIHADYLRGLGADEVIDYRRERFWELAKNVDLVFDLVGGATLANSWQVLSATGKIVSIAAPEIMANVPSGKTGVWHQMRPDAVKLAEIAALVAQGELKVEISEICELAEAAAAIERNKTGHGPGKAVVRFS
jgi:NADPH:quinone reductase-like Zn-dependent oxidoreductase